MIRVGYPAQNLSLPATTNRTLRLANLPDADRVRALVRRNVADLEEILRWNSEHGAGLFRIGQSLVPFASHPDFPYDWASEHADDLQRAGGLASSLGVRLSFHPGQFVQPGSPRPDVAGRSLAELRYVARALSMLGSRDGVVVLHLGGAHGDKEAAKQRFLESLSGEDEVLRFLALENDERTWTVEETVEVARRLGIPAIVDTLHHALNPGGFGLGEALDLGLPTWAARGTPPKLHTSDPGPGKETRSPRLGDRLRGLVQPRREPGRRERRRYGGGKGQGARPGRGWRTRYRLESGADHRDSNATRESR